MLARRAIIFSSLICAAIAATLDDESERVQSFKGKLRVVSRMVQRENLMYSLANGTDSVSAELKAAVFSNDFQLVRELLMSEHKPTSDQICTLARLSVIRGNVDMAESLVKLGFQIDQLDFKKVAKGSPTSLLVLLYDLARIKALFFYFQQGGNLDYVDENWNTPLHVAAIEENWFIADVLIEKLMQTESDPYRNFVNKDGLSTFHVISAGMNPSYVKLFLENTPNLPIDAAVSLDSKFRPGYTALHFSAERCRSEAGKILRARGANPRALTKDGKNVADLLCKPWWLANADDDNRDEL